MTPPPGGGHRTLRPVEPRDHGALLELNAHNEELLAPMDEARLALLLEWSDRADIIDLDGEVAGFVLAFAPGCDYDSENYREFGRRYGRDFYYLDRIAISDGVRRQGLGGFVYEEIEAVARPYGRLALEVNVRPPNLPSLAFHEARGFRTVGELGTATRAVALMTKEFGHR